MSDTDFEIETPEIKHSYTVREIREWGSNNGYDVPPKGRVPVEVREAFNKAHDIATPTRTNEVAPKYQPQTVAGRVKEAFNRKPQSAAKTRKKHPRVSVADIVSGAWWLLSKAAQPISSPMANMIALEAPVAGMVLDDIIAGSLIDKALQPIARTEESGKAAAGLLLPIILTGLIDKNPGMADNLLPVLRKSLQWHIEVAGPKVEEMIAKEIAFESQYGETVDAMILKVFNVETESADASAD